MFTLRLMAVAMLFHGDDLLMMKRSPTRTLSPGKWAGIGGHLDPSEIGDPYTACIREVYEETGLRPEDIVDLKLRYILLRLNGKDLRQQFVYAGRALRRDVALTEEGELHWIPRGEILNRDLPYVFRSILEHYLAEAEAEGPTDRVWMGTATLESEDGDSAPRPAIRWVEVTDPGLA